MDRGSLAALLAITAAVAGAVSFSGEIDGVAADKDGAVAVAILASLGDYIEEDQLRHPPEQQIGDLVLCLDTEISLDIVAIQRALSGTLIRVLPAKNCTSKTVEGDFGMFTAMTTWFDENGEEAGHLQIANVHCPTGTRCLVDIDSVGAGMTYEARRSGKSWSVTGESLRWIV
jgi:hypothetical protein